MSKSVKKAGAARRGSKAMQTIVRVSPTVTAVRTVKSAPKKGKIGSKVIEKAVRYALLARKSKKTV